MKIAILETGMPPAGLDASFGTYPEMFRVMLAPHLPELDTIDVRLPDGDALPSPGVLDAVMVTGSPAGVRTVTARSPAKAGVAARKAQRAMKTAFLRMPFPSSLILQ